MELILLAAAAGLIALLWVRGSAAKRLRRAMANAPQVLVREAGDGQVAKLVGRLRLAEEPLAAPFSGRACAYFEAIFEQSELGHSAELWRTVSFEKRHHTRVWLEDDSGRALVLLESPTVFLTMDVQADEGAGPCSARELVGDKRLRRREGALEPGERIGVVGLCRWEADPDGVDAGAVYREPPRRLTVRAAGGQLLVSDEPALIAPRG